VRAVLDDGIRRGRRQRDQRIVAVGHRSKGAERVPRRVAVLHAESRQRDGRGDILSQQVQAVSQRGHTRSVVAVGNPDDEDQHGPCTSVNSVWYAAAIVVIENARAT